jgi:hypothetical protein
VLTGSSGTGVVVGLDFGAQSSCDIQGEHEGDFFHFFYGFLQLVFVLRQETTLK